MRKEIVYSLAALTGIPVMVNATNADTQLITKDAVTSPQGLKITLATNVTLVKAAKYQLIFADVNAPADLKVYITIGDAEPIEKTLGYGENKFVEFELPNGGTITKIEVEGTALTGTDKGKFVLSSPAINLVYDFAAAAQALQAPLSLITDTVSNYASYKKNPDTSLLTEPQNMVNKVLNADKGATGYNAEAYDTVYVRYKLYEGIGNDEITKKMKENAAEAKANEVTYLNNVLSEQQTALNALGLDSKAGLGKTIQDAINDIDNKIGQFEAWDGNPEHPTVRSEVIQAALAANQAALNAAAASKAFLNETAKPKVQELKDVLAFAGKKIGDALNNAQLKAQLHTDSLTIGAAISKLDGKIDAAYKAGELGNTATPKWADEGEGDNLVKGLASEADSIFKGEVAKVNGKITNITPNVADEEVSLIEELYTKYASLSLYMEWADSVQTNDTLFTPTKFTFAEAERRSLPYLQAKYDDAITTIFGDDAAAIIGKLTKGVNDSVGFLRDSVMLLATGEAYGQDGDNFNMTTYMSTPVQKVIKALDDYEVYAPYAAMLDSIQGLKDSLDFLNTEYKVKVGNHEATYTPITYLEDITEKIGLSKDSIVEEDIQALQDTVVNAAIVGTYKNSMSTFFNGEAKTGLFFEKTKTGADPKSFKGYTAILTDITNLCTAAKTAAEEWMAIQEKLFLLQDSLAEVEALAKAKGDVYYHSVDVKNGNDVIGSYGGYKAKIDSIRATLLNEGVFTFALVDKASPEADPIATTYTAHSIQTLSDSLTSVLDKREGYTSSDETKKTHTDAMSFFFGENGVFTQGGANESDTAKIAKAIKALKDNLEKQDSLYKAQAAEAAKDSLKQSIINMIEGLHSDAETLFPEVAGGAGGAIVDIHDYEGAAQWKEYLDSNPEEPSVDDAYENNFFDTSIDAADAKAAYEDYIAALEDNSGANAEAIEASMAKYGCKYDALMEQVEGILDDLQNDVPEDRALVWAHKTNDVLEVEGWDSVQVVAENLRPLVERMQVAKQAAALAVKAAQDEKKAGTAIKVQFDALVTKLGAAQRLVAEGQECADVFANGQAGEQIWYRGEIGRFGQYTSEAIKDSLDANSCDSLIKLLAKDTLEASRNCGLVDGKDGFLKRIKDLDDRLEAAIKKMKQLQKNWDAYRYLVAEIYPLFSNDNQENPGALEEAVEALRAVGEAKLWMKKYEEEAGHQPFYQSELNERLTKKFQGENVADIDREETKADEGLRDSVYNAYLAFELADKKLDLAKAVLELADSLSNVPERAKNNADNYDLLVPQKDELQGRLTAVIEAVHQADEENGTGEELFNLYKATFESLQDKLDAIDLDDLYKKGQLEDKTEITAAIAEIDAALDAIEQDAFEEFAEALKANSDMRGELAEKADDTRDVYQEAVQTQDDYKSFQSPVLRGAVTTAKALVDEYNETLATYPEKINTKFLTVDKAIQDASKAKEQYPEETFKSDTTYFNTLQDEMLTLEDNFVKSINDVIIPDVENFLKQVAKDTANAAKLRDSYKFDTAKPKTTTADLDELIGELRDNYAKLESTFNNFQAGKRTIDELDDTLALFIGYQDELKAEIEAAAQADLEKGLDIAEDFIEEGNDFFDDFDDEDPEVLKWEEDKIAIEGVDAEDEDEDDIPGIQDAIDAGKLTEKHDSIAKVINDFLTKSAYATYAGSVEAEEKWDDAIQAVRDILEDARAYADDFAVGDAMDREGNAFNFIENKLNELEEAAEDAVKENKCKFTATDSATVATLGELAEGMVSLQGDTLQAKNKLDTKYETLFEKEVAFLEAKKTDVLTEFNKYAAKKQEDGTDEDRQQAKEMEDAINDLYDALAEAKADPEATPDDLLEIQEALAALVKTMADEADAAGKDAVKADLKAKAEEIKKQVLDVLEGEDYDGLTDDQKAAWEEKLTEDTVAINTIVEDLIEAADNIIFDKEKIDGKLNDADAQIKKDLADAKAESDKKGKQAENHELADDIMERIQDAYADAIEDLEALETVGPDDFKNKLQAIKKQIDEAQAFVDETKEAGEMFDEDFLEDLDDFEDDVKDNLDDILAKAAKQDMIAIAEDLEEQANAIELDEDDYLATDYEELSDELDNIKYLIHHTRTWGNQTIERGLVGEAQNIDDYDDYEDLKDRADELQERIDELKEKMAAANINGGVKKVLGDLTGDGKATGADVLAMTKALATGTEDELDLEVADLTDDGEVDIEDLAWLEYLATEHELPNAADEEEAEARGWFGDGKSLNVQTISTENGVTRLAINLESDATYQAFQVDINLNGAVVKAASLGQRVENGNLIARTLENGTFRAFTVPTAKTAINGTEGAVLYIDIIGNAEITGTAKFVKSNFGSDKFDLSGTTAIDKLKNAASAAGQKVYNLGGRVMDGLKKGVNILRGEDGAAKKVIKK